MGRVGAILLVIAAIALPSISSAQKLYKWTDETGVLQFYSDIPPEYANRDREADQRARDEIARRDRMLLETYGSAADIEALRDSRVALLDSQIKLTEVYLGNLRKKLMALEAEGSNFKPYTTQPDAPQIPENVALDLSRTTASIGLYEQTLARTRSDQATLKQQFDDDIARFRQLKGE